jgi:ferredoxin
MPTVTAVEQCAGCLLCSLACSYYNSADHTFNLSQSMIQVGREDDGGFHVTFSDECLECGLCVENCHYGVLRDD